MGRVAIAALAALALALGVVSGPPLAVAAPTAAGQAPVPPPRPRPTDPVPGAPGFKPPKSAAVLVPSTTIDRTPVGAAATAPFARGTTTAATTPQTQQKTPLAAPQAAPQAQTPQAASAASGKSPKPGLGTQNFYPLERRALGDRMELLVNLSNGNVVVRDKDLAFAGTGLNTAVNHDYNNQSDDRGAFGQRWTMTTGADVGLDTSDPNTIKLQGPSGYWQNYTSNGSGGYTSPSGADAKLAKNGSGWTLTFDKTKEKWNFDQNGYFTSQVDKNNNTITYKYNPDNTLASITDTRGAVTTFDYDALGRVVRMKDPTGFVYGDYTYDLQGRHTGFTDPTGKHVAYGYDTTTGDLTSITDPNGNVFKLTYDNQRRVTKIEEPREAGANPATAVTTYDYSTANQTKETAPTGGNTTYFFDSQGRQTKATDPLNRSQAKTYTANSDANTTTSVGGNVSTASYDPNNNLIGTQLPTGAKSTVGYTDAANPNAPTAVTDSEGRQTTLTYDAKGNPLTAKQAQTGQGITRTYNSNGTVKDSTDGRGSKTSYTYDGSGRLLTVTPPAPRQPIRYTYDARSRITSVTDGNNNVLKYDYDAADRVTQLSRAVSGGDQVVQQTDFDGNGNKAANYFDGFTTQFGYSPRNQVLSGVRRNGILVGTDTVTYTYDANDNLASLTDAGGTTTYAYNQANDLTTLGDITGRGTTFTYDGDGNRSNTFYPNGASEARSYDKSKRVTRINNRTVGAADSVRTYGYAGANNADTSLVQIMGEPNNSTTRYSYDGSARLLRALNTNNANGATITDYGYGYDASSNVTGFQGKTQKFNAADELTGIDNTAAGADNQGNFTSASGTSVTYTATNQQDTKSTPDIGFDVYYDTADNSQINHIDDQTNTGAQFEYDFTQTALGMTGRVRDGQGRYSISRLPDGTPAMQKNPDGSTHYFELDRQGSIMGSTNNKGSRTAAFHYKPYGDYDYVSGADSGNGDNFLGFQGGFFHSAPRNSALGYRWYSPTIGQFTQPDPIGTPGATGSGQDNRSGISGPYSEDGNPFTFAAANPCNATDPSGLDAQATCNAVGTLAGFGSSLGVTAATARLTGAAASLAVALPLSLPFLVFGLPGACDPNAKPDFGKDATSEAP